MAKSLIGKIAQVLTGPTRPQGRPEYGGVVVPWYKQLWRAIRPPEKVPAQRKPMTRKQRRMIFGTLAAIVFGVAGWFAYDYLTSAHERSMNRLTEGMRLVGANDLEGARAKFSGAIDVWPENARAYLERGNVNRILGDKTAALEDWNRAIQLDRNMSDAYTARATLYRLDGDLARAIEDLNRAIEIRPTMDAYFQRGQVYHAQGEYQKALEDYDRSIDHQPSAPYVYRARAATRAQMGDREGSLSDHATADRLEQIRQ